MFTPSLFSLLRGYFCTSLGYWEAVSLQFLLFRISFIYLKSGTGYDALAWSRDTFGSENEESVFELYRVMMYKGDAWSLPS